MRTWKKPELTAGTHILVWDTRDEQGHLLPPGVYTCHLQTNDYQGSLKMILIR